MTDIETTDDRVRQAASLYTHINSLRDAQGQAVQAAVHYHLGFQYATEALADKLAGLGVDSSWRLLDVCCGWGGPTRYLAERFACQITGVDITERSIELAKELTKGLEFESLLTFRQGNALDLPIDDGAADLVWSEDAFCHVPDHERLLAQCFRVLRPGGYLVFTDWLEGEWITPEELRTFCTTWSFPNIETLESYRSLLLHAGFEIIACEEVGREYAAGGEALVIGRGGPSFVQRTAARDAAKTRQIAETFGRQAVLDLLEREKMDIYFAQGKMDLGRFVCRKP